MKKLCYSAVVAFFSSVATIMALHVLAESHDQGNTRTGAAEPRTYTAEEVAKHNNLQDCWMVIEGKVYDLSTYVPKHPTPPAVLVPWCGKEATLGMRTKGYGSDHSPYAWSELAEYLIGELSDQ
ncbi:MAG: cytochrome b5 domain-containing protein [Pseudomonadota bacterium]